MHKKSANKQCKCISLEKKPNKKSPKQTSPQKPRKANLWRF